MMTLKPIQNSGLPAGRQESAASVTDGTSNTIIVAETSKKEAGGTGLRAQSGPDTAAKAPDGGASRLAENKMQADLRAAELKSQLDAPGAAANFMDYTDDDCMDR